MSNSRACSKGKASTMKEKTKTRNMTPMSSIKKENKPLLSSKKSSFPVDSYKAENNTLKSELNKISQQFKTENEKLHEQLNLTNLRYSNISAKFENEFIKKDQEINKLEKILSKIDQGSQDNTNESSQNRNIYKKLKCFEKEKESDKENYDMCFKNKELEEKINKYEAEKRTTLTDSKNSWINSMDCESLNVKTYENTNSNYMKSHIYALDSLKKELRNDHK